MTHGSLFSGIGGFDLTAEWLGWENKFHCEINVFCQKILKHYWPNATLFTDITKTDFKPYENKIDILTGGFPCQPYSVAGKRMGKEDERHLWPHMLRAIREIKPRWVVGENVRGLINWNGGMVFDEVQSDLEAEGYQVTPFLLPACGVNAPHQRYRIWFVAYSINNGQQFRKSGKDRCQTEKSEVERNKWERFRSNIRGISKQETITDANSSSRWVKDYKQQQTVELEHARTSWSDWPTQPPLCFRDDGLSSQLDGITFPKWRAESIKAAGNAIVPQVVFQIFDAIDTYEILY